MKTVKQILLIILLTLLVMTGVTLAIYEYKKLLPPIHVVYRDTATEKDLADYNAKEAQYKLEQMDAGKQSLMIMLQAIVPIMLAIIAFWLKKFVDRIDLLSEKVETIAVSQSAQRAGCVEKHISLDKSIDDNSREISRLAQTSVDHEGRISKLEGEIEK